MRPNKADSQKEGLVWGGLELLEALDGFDGDLAIIVCVIGNIGIFAGGAFAISPFLALRKFILRQSIIAGLGPPMGSRPRRGIVSVAMTLVIDFSEGRGRVSRSHESLGQGYGVWNSRPEVGFQIVNPNRVRAQTCHQGIAGGRAYRLIAVGAIKKRRAGGEFINVRGLHLAVSVASEKGLEVIHANQKDIRLLGPECTGRK
jgi:hypothetical protein